MSPVLVRSSLYVLGYVALWSGQALLIKASTRSNPYPDDNTYPFDVFLRLKRSWNFFKNIADFGDDIGYRML